MDDEKRRLTSAVDVLQGLFENGKSPLSPQFMRWRLEQSWEQVVGKTVAENSRPGNYIRGTLYLAVRHPVWIQQLKFMEGEIKRKVNSFAREDWVSGIKYYLDDGGGPLRGE